MEKKASKSSFVMSILLFLSLLIGLVIPTQNVQADSISVCASGCDYTTIQEAIDAASDGDTINIAAETFDLTGIIVVNKSLTLTGASGGGTILQGTNSAVATILEITASNVTIQNLEITHNALPPFVSPGWNELANSLVRIPNSLSLSSVTITGNTIHVPAQAGPMSSWGGVALTVGDGGVADVIITDNTVYNTRNGIVVRTNNTATVNDNIIYNTKGGIMNYTASQEDANHRTVNGNSWRSAHNEWDIVWNTAYYVPDYPKRIGAFGSKP